MKTLKYIIYFLFLFNIANAQESINKNHLILRELIDNKFYSIENLIVDSIPCDNFLSIGGSYIDQYREKINENLNQKEIMFLFKICDSTKCFAETNKIETKITLCDSTKLPIYLLNRERNSNRITSFKWNNKRLIQKKNNIWKSDYKCGFSTPITNREETILVIHIIDMPENQHWSGSTILYKKNNDKWEEICPLDGWTE